MRDLTARGSGNIGATNVSRVVGFWPAGFLTLLLDVLKGAVPVVVVQLPAFEAWWAGVKTFGGEINEITVWSVAFFAVAGHCFSPWMKFKGGKGVATGLGAIAALSPISAGIGIVGFVLTFLNTRIGSLSSLMGLAFASAAYLVLVPVGVHSWFGLAIVALIIFRHEGNINSLLENRERAF